MADNDQYNDEYQFADLDEAAPALESETESLGTDHPVNIQSNNDNNMRRNIIIVVISLVLLIGLYKIVGAFFSGKKPVAQTTVPSLASATPEPPPVQTQPSMVAVPQTPPPSVDNNFSQKLSDLETGQQTIRTDVSSVNSQLSGIGNSINAMATKMAELNSIITTLSTKVEEQSREIDQLTIRREAKRVHYVSQRPRPVPYMQYYIQAVIPGRAWLIGTNGSTLTVREGTVIAGYGVVKLIDPNQGRVMTSSGRVIKFSQDDS